MAASITFKWQSYYQDANGALRPLSGTLSEPLTVTLSGSTFIDNWFSVATSTTQVLLDLGSTSTSDLAAFTYLEVTSDQIVTLELQGTTAAANSNVKLAANRPFILFSNGTLAYNAAGGFAGAAQSILKVTVSNASGSTAKVRCIAAY